MQKAFGCAAFAIAFLGAVQLAHAAGNPQKGRAVFSKCSDCHEVGASAKNKAGPVLNNILEAKAGSKAGFNYSQAMRISGEKGLVWNESALDGYLKKPRKFIPGTTTGFSGLRSKSARADIIAYLKTFSKK